MFKLQIPIGGPVMKKSLIASLVLLGFLLVLIPFQNNSSAEYIGDEIPIVTGSGTQGSPDIFDNYVVWHDNRYGNFDIFLYGPV